MKACVTITSSGFLETQLIRGSIELAKPINAFDFGFVFFFKFNKKKKLETKRLEEVH